MHKESETKSFFIYMVTRKRWPHFISPVCFVRNLRVEMDMYLWPTTVFTVYRYIYTKFICKKRLNKTHINTFEKRKKRMKAAEASTTTTTKFK